MFRVQDKYIDLKQIQQQITEERKKEGADPIADEADAYGGLTVFEGRAEEQIRQLENQEVRPMVEEMKARDISLEMIDEFLLNHSQVFNNKGNLCMVVFHHQFDHQ